MNHFFNATFRLALTGLACLCFISAQAQEKNLQEPDTLLRQEADKSLLSPERLEENFATTWTTLLQQEIPGMTPGMLFRMQESLLIVLDGVPLDPSLPLEQVLPSPTQLSDIQFIKGPEALAKYGVRGSYGVLILKTKSGEFDKGFQTGLYSGFRSIHSNHRAVYPGEDIDIPAVNNWSESLYLSWSNEKNSLYANYTLDNLFTPEVNEMIYNEPGYWMYYVTEENTISNHSLNLRFQSKLSDDFLMHAGGVYQMDNEDKEFYNMNTGFEFTPSEQLQMQFNTGINNRLLISESVSEYLGISDDLHLVNKDIDFRMQMNRATSSNFKLLAETGLSYFSNELRVDIKKTNSYFNEDNEVIEKVELMNGQLIAGMQFHEWLTLKAGTHYNIMLIENEDNFHYYSPYASLDMDFMRFAKGNSALSQFSFNASYGQLSKNPILLLRDKEEFSKGLRRFEAGVNIGFWNERITFSSTYFSDKYIQSQEAIIYSGMESRIRGRLIDQRDFQWTAGLNNFVIRQTETIELTEEQKLIYFEYGIEVDPEKQYPLKWQTGLFNRLSWKGLNLTAYANMQNSKHIGFEWNFYGPVDEIIPSDKSRWYVDLQELTLSYTLPQSLLDHSVFRKVNLAMSGRNLFQTSNFDLLETVYMSDRYILPSYTKSYSFSVGLHF